MYYLLDTLEQYNTDIAQAINRGFEYFENNKGNSKPNAANIYGMPYHVYEDVWQWQISPSSTTSECLSIFLRSCIACRKFDYAKRVADFILEKLTFDNISTVHWLIDLAGATEMESVRLGNYDSSVFHFTDGIATIPSGFPHFGDKVSHVRVCFTVEAEFPYPDYFIGLTSGAEKRVQNWFSHSNGTTIILEDLTFTGDLQVFYSYYNGVILEQNDIYRTYPRNTKCIKNGNEDYQISVATDAVLWTAIALKELALAIDDKTYSDKARLLLEKLNSDMVVAEDFTRIFDATYRGFVWDSVGTYDESGIRYPYLEPNGKHLVRFDYGGDLDSRAVSWAIGKSFQWKTDSRLDITVSGKQDYELRHFIVKDNGKEYFYPWYDNFTGFKTYSLKKSDFVSLNNAYLDASRIPYLEPYVTSGTHVNYTLSKAEYNASYKDNLGLYYPLWHRLEYSVPRYPWNFIIIGAGTPGNFSETKNDDFIHLVLAGNPVRNARLFFRVIDANDKAYRSQPFNVSLNPALYSFRIGDLNPEIEGDTIAHPIKNIDLMIMVFDANPAFYTSGNLYIGSVYLNSRELFTGNQSDFLKFETRQKTYGSFDIAKAILNEPVTDKYHHSGVPVFTLEYTELGLMAWRSGSYSGYTNPAAWIDYSDNYNVAIEFLLDVQDEYFKRFNILAPFMPVYNRNLTENIVYGELEEWTFNGPDTNTTWAGFQYRSLVTVAESYYQRFFFKDGVKDVVAETILDRWVEFLTKWFKLHDHLPSYFSPTGSVEYTYTSPDFAALVGRAMMLKYMADNDLKALELAQKMLKEVLSLQQENGAFYSGYAFGFHQAEVLLFLGQWLNLFQKMCDIRRTVMYE